MASGSRDDEVRTRHFRAILAIYRPIMPVRLCLVLVSLLVVSACTATAQRPANDGIVPLTLEQEWEISGARAPAS